MDACGVLDASGGRLFKVIGGMDKRLCFDCNSCKESTA